VRRVGLLIIAVSGGKGNEVDSRVMMGMTVVESGNGDDDGYDSIAVERAA